MGTKRRGNIQRKRRHEKSRPKPAATTSLARIPNTSLARIKRYEILPAVTESQALEAKSLGEEVVLGALGLAELKLTAKEETVLAREVNLADVRMKPTGQPYLSHPTYTRWLNEAFGRLGWTLAPAAKPMRSGNSVVCPYLLFVHGQPVAFAFGEQEYFENNREQTYGDALEATHASALRRVAKRLGVGLELWDKEFLDRYIADYCVKVRCKISKHGESPKFRFQWRRKSDPRFWNEVGQSEAPAEGEAIEEDDATQRRAAPEWERREDRPRGGDRRQQRSAGYNSRSGEVITDAQRKRLWVIIRNSGRVDEVVHEWLSRRYGWSSTKSITRAKYDEICRAIEAPGHLS